MEFLEDSSENKISNVIDDLKVLKDNHSLEHLENVDQINELIEVQQEHLKTDELTDKIVNNESNILKQSNDDILKETVEDNHKENEGDFLEEIVDDIHKKIVDDIRKEIVDDIHKEIVDDIRKENEDDFLEEIVDDIHKEIVDDIHKEKESIGDLIDHENQTTNQIDLKEAHKKVDVLKKDVQEDNLTIDLTNLSVNELTESTKQLLVDLNSTGKSVLDSSNLLDSSNVLNSSNLENLTPETFLDNSVPSNHRTIDLLDCSADEMNDKHGILECSVNDEMSKDCALNLTQETSLDDSNKENLANLSQQLLNKNEDLLHQLQHNTSSKQLDEQLDEQPQQSTESKELSTLFINDESNEKLKDEPKDELKEETKVQLKDESMDKSNGEFFNELNKELNKTVDKFMNTIESIEQVPEVPQTLEDFVTETKEIDEAKLNEPELQLINVDDNQVTTDQSVLNENLVIENSESPKKINIEAMLINELKNEDNQESVAIITPTPIKETSKIEDVLNESQEILKQADELIALKKNSIPNEINIPGLDISCSNEEVEKTESILKDQVASIEPTTVDEQPEVASDESTNEANKSTKQASSRKCVIS